MELTPEEHEAVNKAYAASYAGKVEQLDRELRALKRAILDALPYPIQRMWRWVRGERWVIVAVSEWPHGRAVCYRQYRACIIDHQHIDGTRHPTIPSGTRDEWHCLNCHAERNMETAEFIHER
jgi:hypothetical protein